MVSDCRSIMKMSATSAAAAQESIKRGRAYALDKTVLQGVPGAGRRRTAVSFGTITREVLLIASTRVSLIFSTRHTVSKKVEAKSHAAKSFVHNAPHLKHSTLPFVTRWNFLK